MRSVLWLYLFQTFDTYRRNIFFIQLYGSLRPLLNKILLSSIEPEQFKLRAANSGQHLEWSSCMEGANLC